MNTNTASRLMSLMKSEFRFLSDQIFIIFSARHFTRMKHLLKLRHMFQLFVFPSKKSFQVDDHAYRAGLVCFSLLSPGR